MPCKPPSNILTPCECASSQNTDCAAELDEENHGSRRCKNIRVTKGKVGLLVDRGLAGSRADSPKLTARRPTETFQLMQNRHRAAMR
jgi:hypothetical protein